MTSAAQAGRNKKKKPPPFPPVGASTDRTEGQLPQFAVDPTNRFLGAPVAPSDVYTLGPALRIAGIKNMGRDLALEELRISHDCPVGHWSTAPRSAVYHPVPRCLPPHAPLSTTPCPAAYHPMTRCLLAHAPLATTPYTHTWRSEGGARCGRGGENPMEACTYLRTGPGSRHGHGA